MDLSKDNLGYFVLTLLCFHGSSSLLNGSSMEKDSFEKFYNYGLRLATIRHFDNDANS